mmetsp:Transcript_2842/g.5531  ORF Transcript_2842/g.5531 Transcript_2842/m.5531 type:complete len:154 (-) Transcript_2842:80-541(-)
MPGEKPPIHRTFDQLVKAMQGLRSTTKQDDGYVMDYDGGTVRLVPGKLAGVNWVHIYITLTGFEVGTRFDWAQKLLVANKEMCQATPIPSWFAVDKGNRVLFVNRLDWQYLPPPVLDDHILRNISQMKEALLEEGVGRILAQRHHAPNDLHTS